MADSLIKDLPTVLSDAQVDDNTKLLPFGNNTTGVAGQGSMGQVKLATSTKKEKYVATGAEGTTITIAILAGRYILAIFREGSCLYEVTSPTVPDNVEFTFDSTNIELGLATNPGERFLILWKNI